MQTGWVGKRLNESDDLANMRLEQKNGHQKDCGVSYRSSFRKSVAGITWRWKRISRRGEIKFGSKESIRTDIRRCKEATPN